MIARTMCLAALSLLLTAGRSQAACKLGELAQFPVTMVGLKPLVTLKINGQDMRFVADTGAFYSMISPANAQMLRLPTEMAPYLWIKGINGEADASIATVRKLDVLGRELPNVQFVVAGSEPGAGAAGLLGENVLGIADGEYDLANGVIRLMQPDGCRNVALAYWDRTKPYSVVDIKGPDRSSRLSTLTPSPQSEALIDGAKIRVMFDTGFSVSAVSLAAAARAGVTPNSPGVVPGGYFTGVGRGRVQTWIAPFSSFKIGDEEIRNTKLRIGAFISDDTDMWLGEDFFLSHHVYVANSQRKLYFTYNGGPVFNLSAQPEAAEPKPGGVADAAPPSVQAKAEPATAEAFEGRGEAEVSRRQLEPAIADLTRAVALQPTEARYRYERGVAYISNKQPFLAMADFDEALKLKPDDVPALVARAELRLAGRDRSQALEDMDAVDRLAPKEGDVRLTLGRLYLRVDAFAQALIQFDDWIRVHAADARMPNALQGRCWARAQLGQDLQKALADCNGAARGDATNATIVADRGLVRLRLGDYDKALADYEIALAKEPKNAWALYGRGLAKARKGAQADGKADMDAAIALQPKLPEIFKARGID
jgi:tetratricopeptide (TPR) repeat protein/predicted aspartyl protease